MVNYCQYYSSVTNLIHVYNLIQVVYNLYIHVVHSIVHVMMTVHFATCLPCLLFPCVAFALAHLHHQNHPSNSHLHVGNCSKLPVCVSVCVCVCVQIGRMFVISTSPRGLVLTTWRYCVANMLTMTVCLCSRGGICILSFCVFLQVINCMAQTSNSHGTNFKLHCTIYKLMLVNIVRSTNYTLHGCHKTTQDLYTINNSTFHILTVCCI